MSQVQTLPRHPLQFKGGRIIPDRFYNMREAAAFTGLPKAALGKLLERAGQSAISLEGRDYLFGATILLAMEDLR